MSDDHATYAPSAASRWVLCSASPALEASAPEAQQSEEAREGDAAHFVAATTLRTLSLSVGASLTVAQVMPREMDVAPNNVIITDEMLDAAQIYIEDVIATCGPDALDKLHIEEHLPDGPFGPDNWGRPDVWWASAGANGAYIFIYDFKFGHRFVDAFENWQMLNYLALILARPEFAAIDRANIEVVFNVVQPRNYHPSGPIRRWNVRVSQIEDYFRNLATAIHEASTAPIARPNPECRDCKGRWRCQALHNAADSALDQAGFAVPFDLDDIGLGLELKMLKHGEALLKARITGLEEQVLSALRAGRRIPWFHVSHAQGKERWTVDAGDVIAMGAAFGVDVAKPGVMTPKQAREAGFDADTVKAISARPAGAAKLEITDDKHARKVFG
jgi:hypothetical protein